LKFEIKNISGKRILFENSYELKQGKSFEVKTLTHYMSRLFDNGDIQVFEIRTGKRYINVSPFRMKLIVLKEMIKEKNHHVNFIY